MPPHYKKIISILVNTIGNYLIAIKQGHTRKEKVNCSKMMFNYIISEKQNVLDMNIMNERFIYTMKDKLIELHDQNVPWAYNYYLLLFDNIMPDVVNEIILEDENIDNENGINDIDFNREFIDIHEDEDEERW